MYNLYSSLDLGLFSYNSTSQRIAVSQKSVMFLVSRWYLLFLLIKLGSANYFMQQAIKAFGEFQSVKCHILLFTYADVFYEQRVLLDFYKAVIKNNHIPTVLENINSESRKNSGVSSRKQCSRPLRSFIMGNLTYLENYMASEKKRENTLKDVWLLFLTNDSDQELITSQIEFSIGREVFIAKQTTRGYEFWEIYKTTKSDRIRIIFYGNWNTHEGLKAIRSSVVERRGDFGGAVLRVLGFEWERDNSDDEKRVKLLKVIWNLLEQKLNFTTKIVFIPNNSSKYQLHSTMIDITIQMLARKEADVSLIRHWPISSRMVLVDSSRPLFHTEVYIQTLESIDSWFHYFQPFAIRVWYSVVSMITLLLVIILLMHHLSRKTGLVRTRSSFLDVCFMLHQMLCQQGGELRQELGSISLLFVFINLWMFLVRGMYSASLTSTLAIHQHNVPFNSLEGLLANGQYEFGVHRYSWSFAFFYKYGNSFVKKLNKNAMEKNISNLPVTYLEGLRRVCSGRNYAFLANNELIFELRSKIPCKLDYLTQEMIRINFDYAMSKHNEYLPFINRWLQVFREVGLIDRLKRDLLRIVSDTVDDPKSFKSLELKDTALLQLVLLGGVVLSIIIFIAEIIYDRMKRNRRNLSVC